MDPYNVKIVTYPDATKQVRIYRKTVCPPDNSGIDRLERERNPFDGKTCTDLLVDLDGYDYHVSEVSLKRSKKKVYDYARSNEWDWFVTFTFSQKKVNRFDYDECVKKLSYWLNYLKKCSPALSYLVVPERHKDGAWHFHGLFAGVSESQIVWSGRYVVKRYRKSGRSKFVRTSEKIYQVGSYKLGWMTATRVRDKERATSYITKYLTKELLDGLYGRKRYWVSRNLLLPVEEVYSLDETDRFILGCELGELATYRTVSSVQYGELAQSVEIYEL